MWMLFANLASNTWGLFRAYTGKTGNRKDNIKGPKWNSNNKTNICAKKNNHWHIQFSRSKLQTSSRALAIHFTFLAEDHLANKRHIEVGSWCRGCSWLMADTHTCANDYLRTKTHGYGLYTKVQHSETDRVVPCPRRCFVYRFVQRYKTLRNPVHDDKRNRKTK